MAKNNNGNIMSAGFPGTRQKGAVLVYLVAAILIAGILGAGIVSLTTTSTFSGLTYNTSDRARYLARAGLDFSEAVLFNSGHPLHEEFTECSDEGSECEINNTVFSLSGTEEIVISIIRPDWEESPNRYHVRSTGRVNPESGLEAGFLLADTFDAFFSEAIGIDFASHDIQRGFLTGDVVHQDDPSYPGYTYDGESLVLYDEAGRELMTIRSDQTLRYSQWQNSIGTTWGGLFEPRGTLGRNDSIEAILPDGQYYTELTIYFSGFPPDNTARVSLASASRPNIGSYDIGIGDITDLSATITTDEPFDRFTIRNVSHPSADYHFGISGFAVQ